MQSVIIVSRDFERHWPFIADHFLERWQAQGATELIRVADGDDRALGALAPAPEKVTRLVTLGVAATRADVEPFTALSEAAFPGTYRGSTLEPEAEVLLKERGVELYQHQSEGFWGQSVAEIGLALTICGLRQIPQQHHEIQTSHEKWTHYNADKNQGPGTIGVQFCDDVRFTHGTVQGKRVRIVGAGNISSRYASFMSMLGADVAVWDPFAPEPSFHRAGSRRVMRLEELVRDAEIFVPMVPLTESTRGLVPAELIDALPTGCLVVTVTRARIVDTDALRRRVLNDELALAADVFDVEPLPLDDPLLGRHNVVHTPHIAGRTLDSNHQWVENLVVQFRQG